MRRAGIAGRIGFASLAIVASAVTVSIGIAPAGATSTVHVQGSVHCHGGAVTGIWLADSAGGSNWATRYNFSTTDTSDNRYGLTVPVGSITFKVGCGGTTSKWATTNTSSAIMTSSIKIPTSSQLLPPGWQAAATVNLFCGNGNASGPCNAPAVGNKASSDLGDSCQCTYYALNWWHSFEGFWPAWSGNAGSWASTAAANKWSVTTVPMADSIVVFPDFGSGALAVGHVGWVTGLIPGANHTVAGLYVDQGNVDDHGNCDSGSVETNTAFYFSSYPSGDKTFPSASSWRYIVAPIA